MNRQQKELVVQLFRENFTNSPASFVVGYRGMTVSQMQDLRTKLRESGGLLRVTKARLMKRALENVEDGQALIPHMHDQIGVVFVLDEPTAVAKVLSEFSKENKALSLVVGRLDRDILDSDGIVRIASLPSKQQLLGILCGTLNAPIHCLAFVLSMQIGQLLLVLKQVAQKKK